MFDRNRSTATKDLLLSIPTSVDNHAPSADCFVPLGWHIEVVESYDKSISIVLIPEGDDNEGPTLSLYEMPGGVEMFACRWDRICRVGAYGSFEACVEAIVLLTSTPAETEH